MTTGIGLGWEPHGYAEYRTNAQGQRVWMLPTRCVRGEHVLTLEACRIWEHEGVLRVSCQLCGQRPDCTWALKTGGQRAELAEFDDAPYQRLLAARRAAATER